MQPSFLHTFSYAKYKHRTTGNFFIRIFFIQQLMPQTVFPLIPRYPTSLHLEILYHILTHRMIFRHSCQQIGCRHKNPSIGPGPMRHSMFLIIRMIAMIINLFFRTPQISCIIQYLIGSIIKILLFTSNLSHAGNKRHRHKRIICPNCIFMRP